MAAGGAPGLGAAVPVASVDWGTIVALALGVLLLAVMVLQDIGNRRPAACGDSAALSKFQALYLPPFLLATFADWIQGPYQYKVYTQYGFDEHDIGRLYICGFGSSLLFGTYVAAVADTYGRKSNCLLYCLVYSLSCLTKNSPNYHWLMLGRVLGGMATSILFASFESWCITAYRSNPSLEAHGLDAVFTNIAFANALTAIVSSLFGDFLVTATGDLIAPFNFVPLVLACCALLIATTWSENYGGGDSGDGGGESGQGSRTGDGDGEAGRPDAWCGARAFLNAAATVRARQARLLLLLLLLLAQDQQTDG